jgi:hypothetical protein
MLVRIVRFKVNLIKNKWQVTPVKGTPSISVICRASIHYNSQFPDIETGSNHIKFEGNEIKISKNQSNL